MLGFSASASGQNADETLVDRDPAGAPYRSGELLVALDAGVDAGKPEEIARAAGATVEDTFPDLDAVLISFPGIRSERAQEAREKALEKARESLEKNPLVESADYNYLRRLYFVPNDPLFKQQWGLRKPGYPGAWNRAQGERVKVGIVDSGIASRHPDLRWKIDGQADFVNKDRRADDRVGHGTHVAGIIAARTDNRTGIAGGCPRCRLLVAKSVGANGGYDSDIARGITWAAKRGARVINLSLGGPGNSAVLKRAVNRALKRGVVVVSAVGNENTSRKSYPAAYRGVIGVAATTAADKRARFSNFGGWVDVAAPGTRILSTYPGGRYRRFSGTSMASPHVAALAGLLAGQGLSKEQIRYRILSTAKDLGRKGRDPYFGAGRIRPDLAVK